MPAWDQFEAVDEPAAGADWSRFEAADEPASGVDWSKFEAEPAAPEPPKEWDAWTGEVSPQLKAQAPWMMPPPVVEPPPSLTPEAAPGVVRGGVAALTPYRTTPIPAIADTVEGMPQPLGPKPEAPPIAPQFESPTGIGAEGPRFPGAGGPVEPSIYEEPTFYDKGMGYVSNVARAIPADVAETVAGNEPYYELHNLAAAAIGEPMPIDEALKEASTESKTWATVGKISQGIAATAPMLAIGHLPAAAQQFALAAFTAQMIAGAPEIASQLGNELGKPKDQQDPDKISSLVSEAVQIIGFAPAAALGLHRGMMPGPVQGPVSTGELLKMPKRVEAPESSKQAAMLALGQEAAGRTPLAEPKPEPVAAEAVSPVSALETMLDGTTADSGTRKRTVIQTGLAVSNLEHLDDLVALREKYVAISQDKTKPVADRMAATFSGQAAREALEMATNTGSQMESGSTKYGPRPLDFKSHPEVADWMRENADRLKKAGMNVPDEITPKPVVEPSETELEYGTGGEMPDYTQPGQRPAPVKPAAAPAPAAEPVVPAPTPAPAPVVVAVKRPYNMAGFRADASEFENLVQTYGMMPEHGWIQNPDLVSPKRGNYTDISSNAELKKAYLRVFDMLGLKTDRATLKAKAQALPKLKAYLEAHAKMVDTPLEQIPDGSEFTVLGEKHKVKGTDPDTEVVTIVDGKTIKKNMGDSIKIDPGSLKKPAEEAGFGLEQPESVAEQQARLAAEETARQKKAAAEKLASGATQPLVGSRGDLGQRDMLGGGDLFSQEPKPAEPAAGAGEIKGMGGAVPSEFEGNESFVSNMFAAIDRDREAMGKPPMAETRPRTWDEDNQRALAQMNRNPNWIPDLLDAVEKKPRPLLSWENAGVVWHRAKLKAEYNGALQRVARAFDDNRAEDLTAAKVDAAVFEDKLERLDRIVGRNGTGSEAGRSLNAQKMGAGDDFTLVEMTLQKRAAVGGRRLTPQETSSIQKDVDRLNALNAAMQKSLADAEAKASAAESARAIAELKAQAVPTFDKRILAAAESIVVKMEARATDHAAKLREMLRGGGTAALGYPELIYHASIVGSAKIARFGLDSAKFIDAMVTDFGEAIRPHLDEIWKKSNEMLEANLARVPEPVRRVVKKAGAPDIKADVAKAVKTDVDAGDMSKVTWQVQKLARGLIQMGITDREALIDNIHDVLKDVIPGITRRGTMDAISGYGDFKRLTKDRISLTLRGMKGEMQQLAKLEDMAAGKPPLKTGIERREPTAEERRLIKEVNDAKNKFQIPVSDPATQLKSSLDTLKTALKNRIADYEDRLARKDYAPRPRREVQLDTAANRLKAEAERIKKRWRQELLADRMKNRTTWEKALDWSTKFRRFTALSSPVVIPKLLGAAGWRAISTAAEDVAGRALSFVPGIRKISQRAPLEGYGGQLSATMRGFGQAFTKGLRDAADVMKTGHSDIDVLYGKAGESYTGEYEMASALLNFPGRLHGVIKAPVKRGAYEKATQRLAEYYAKQGLDPSDPIVMNRIAVEAYKAGNRAIFLQDNRVASGFNAALAALEKKGETGHPSPGGKALATAARFMFPVTRVPTNIAAETLQYAAGSATGQIRAINAIRKGLDTLTPDQADLIMRELKKGSVGMAALFLGYMGYQNIGGVYEQGKKRKAGEVKPGAVRMFDVDIPENLLHAPVLNTIQLGATIHRTADEKLRKKDPDAQGLSAGVLAASWGLADEVPFVQGPHRLFGGLANPYTRENTIGYEARSIVVPQAVAWLAQVLDERRETPPTGLYNRITGPPARLNPQGIVQNIETGIPGLRQTVPLKKK